MSYKSNWSTEFSIRCTSSLYRAWSQPQRIIVKLAWKTWYSRLRCKGTNSCLSKNWKRREAANQKPILPSHRLLMRSTCSGTRRESPRLLKWGRVLKLPSSRTVLSSQSIIKGKYSVRGVDRPRMQTFNSKFPPFRPYRLSLNYFLTIRVAFKIKLTWMESKVTQGRFNRDHQDHQCQKWKAKIISSQMFRLKSMLVEWSKQELMLSVHKLYKTSSQALERSGKTSWPNLLFPTSLA
jgi:hypothetical protein